MLLPAVFHENLFDDWFDPFFGDMDRELNRETRNTFGKRAANMMKTDVKEVENGYEMDVDLRAISEWMSRCSWRTVI